jgi:Enoyl-(Acyl carrier protein) reductase
VGGLRRVDHPDDLQLDARRQDVELPEPLADSTGIWWICSSSSTPASSARCAVYAPCTSTSRSPAAAFACAIAANALAGDPDLVRARLSQSIPLRRYGEPAEFGRAAAFLLSPAASYLTGAMVPIDGGAIRSI